MHSRDILHKAKGDRLSPLRLEGSETIRQRRLVLFIGDQESQNYSKKTIRLEPTQIRWFRDSQARGWSVRAQANSRATFSKDALK